MACCKEPLPWAHRLPASLLMGPTSGWRTIPVLTSQNFQRDRRDPVRLARRVVFAILSALVAVYIILAIVAFFAQRSMLFPAPRASQEPEMRGSSLHRIPARNGITVFALHVEAPASAVTRSEEHTSELQSQFHLVCRLLLE